MSKDLSSFEKALLPVLETFFVDVHMIHLIVGLICVIVAYLLLKLAFYRFGHPKKSLLNLKDDKKTLKTAKEHVEEDNQEDHELINSANETGNIVDKNSDLIIAEIEEETTIPSNSQDAIPMIEIITTGNDCSIDQNVLTDSKVLDACQEEEIKSEK